MPQIQTKWFQKITIIYAKEKNQDVEKHDVLWSFFKIRAKHLLSISTVILKSFLTVQATAVDTG